MEKDDQDLSDGQIELLLQKAEQQLRYQAETRHQDDRLQKYFPKRPNVELAMSMQPYVNSRGEVAQTDSSRLIENAVRHTANAARKIEDPVTIQSNRLKSKQATSGPNWFNLPKTNLTPQLKRDLQLIQMRSVLDSKRFYKKETTKTKPPEFSQVGTVVEAPTEFYSSRVPKKARQTTVLDEVLTGERENGKFRKKYLEIQAAKTSGKKAHYKARMAKRYGKRLKN